MRTLKSVFTASVLFVAPAILFVVPALASELVLKDCAGGLLAAQKLEDGASSAFEVKVDAAANLPVDYFVSIQPDGASGDALKKSTVAGGLAKFSGVQAGVYRLCNPNSLKLTDVTFRTRAGGQQYAGLLAGVGGIAAVIGISESSRSGNSGASVEAVGLAEPVAEPVAEPISEPSVVTGGPVASSGCSKKKKSGAVAGALEVDDCGSGLSPDPLSPYN